MVLNVSGRTDIVAFYTDWFINRYRDGYVDVRNPFYEKQVSRIYFQNVDAIVFCTKNPHPILPYLNEIKIPIIFQVTLTPYKRDIEPGVSPKGQIIEDIKNLSKLIGKENVWVRYDPIFISPKYSISYHVRAFQKLCRLLNGYVSHIIVSFLDDYKNVRKNLHVLNVLPFQEMDYQIIGKSFSESARKNGMTVQTCFEQRTLVEYGFQKGDCVSHELIYKLTGKTNFKTWKARGKGNCHCIEMVDIGAYNSCSHLCKYCYANYDERKVKYNRMKHDPSSSLLIGTLQFDDQIKIRK